MYTKACRKESEGVATAAAATATAALCDVVVVHTVSRRIDQEDRKKRADILLPPETLFLHLTKYIMLDIGYCVETPYIGAAFAAVEQESMADGGTGDRSKPTRREDELTVLKLRKLSQQKELANEFNTILTRQVQRRREKLWASWRERTRILNRQASQSLID